MPFTSSDQLPKGVKDNLPEHAQSIWMAAFNSAYEGTCKDSDDKDACAAKVAWSAVSKKYEKGEDGKWAEKSEVVAEFSMAIVKASFDKASGEMRWRAVASDTDEDLYNESMSMELFENFLSRIETQTPVPEPFAPFICESIWSGGMPYLSVSHYRSGGGKNIPGTVSAIYIDGKCLKARGVLSNTELGLAVFRALNKDLEGTSEYENPIRISIAFLDLAHKHVFDDGSERHFERKSLKDRCPYCQEGMGKKIYLAGQLVHLAMTRVPVNPRTLMEVERMATNEIKTKKDDAESIVGESLAEALVQDSQAVADALVIKSTDEEEDKEPKHNPDDPECECAGCKKKKEEKSEVAEVPVETPPAEPVAVVEEPVPAPVEEPAPATPEPVSPVQQAMTALTSEIERAHSLGLYGNDGLKAVQPSFDALGQVLMAEFNRPPETVENTPDIAGVIRSTLAEVLPTVIQPALADLSLRIAALESRNTVTPQPQSSVPAPRSARPATTTPVVLSSAPASAPHKQTLKDIAYRSVGIANQGK